MDWIGLDWIGMDWIRLDWNGMEWNGMDWIGLDWIGMEWNGLEFYHEFLKGTSPFYHFALLFFSSFFCYIFFFSFGQFWPSKQKGCLIYVLTVINSVCISSFEGMIQSNLPQADTVHPD